MSRTCLTSASGIGMPFTESARLGVARREHRLARLRRPRLAQHAHHARHVRLEPAIAAERRRVDDQEEVADVEARLARVAAHAIGGAGEHGRQDLHQRGEAVALVAREPGRAAERREQARGQRGLRIGGHCAGGVEGPARLERPAVQLRQSQLADGDGAGRDIEAEGRAFAGGRGEGERIGAEARLGAVRRDDGRIPRGGERHADQAGLGGEHRVGPGSAEVIGVAHRDGSEPGCACLLYREQHGTRARRLAQAAVRVDHSDHRRLAHQARLGAEVQALAGAQPRIERQERDAVRVHAVQVGVLEALGGDARVLRGHSPRAEDLPALRRHGGRRHPAGHGASNDAPRRVSNEACPSGR
jgi:hypothetical protein